MGVWALVGWRVILYVSFLMILLMMCSQIIFQCIISAMFLSELHGLPVGGGLVIPFSVICHCCMPVGGGLVIPFSVFCMPVGVELLLSSLS